MKQLEVPFLPQLNRACSAEQVSASLDSLFRHAVDMAPWPAFQYVPNVEFSIAHNNDCIFLKYYVEEAVVKAAYHQPDDPVFKDSCVEFFIAFNEEETYYNLELNAIGTCKLNVGKNRNERSVIPESLIKTIRFLSVVQNAGEAIQWRLTLIIPKEVFFQHQITTLSGQTCSGNFYKCGDDLPTPHFLCWNKIDTPEPDFHVRRCFGKLLFL